MIRLPSFRMNLSFSTAITIQCSNVFVYFYFNASLVSDKMPPASSCKCLFIPSIPNTDEKNIQIRQLGQKRFSSLYFVIDAMSDLFI